jgi:hypothetical protein
MDLLAPTIEVTEDGVEVRNPEPTEDLSLVELLPLQGFLGVENPSGHMRSEMKEIWDFFAEGSQGEGDALYKVKQTEMKMSPPKLGETRLKKLFNYVKLQTHMKGLTEQLEML